MVKQKLWMSPDGCLLIVDIFGVEAEFGHFLFGFTYRSDDNIEGIMNILKKRNYVCLGIL